MKIKTPSLLLSVLLAAPAIGEAAIVSNGSFENPLNSWTNTASNYMAVASGSTAITGWDVTNATGDGVAWAKSPTGDGFFPSNGTYFVDLSGFGTRAGPNARLEQLLQNLVAGETYSVGIDYWGDRATLAIGGNVIGTAGSASSGWTPLTGSFVATGPQALLTVGYLSNASGVAFVDNLTVTGPEAGTTVGGTIPEPGSIALLCAALGLLGAQRRRR